jgi:small-conductance mechanosensitive channel/CRP-like cAMP-binding protein
MPAQFPSAPQLLLLVGVAAGTYVALVAAAQVLRRSWRLGFGVTYHLFAVAAGLCAGLQVCGWEGELAAAFRQHITAAAIVLLAFPAGAIAVRAFFPDPAEAGKRAAAPRVLADATRMALILVAALLVVQLVYGKSVPGLVAGSGVVAIILGLAMQDMLGNIFAGLGLYFEKNFETGDWILINDTHAKVIEISWRSTRLLTTDDVLIDVPNSDIAKQTITNFERPTPRHAVRATIGLHYDIPPERAQQVLREAAATVPGVCADPAPVIYVKDFADSAIVYEIKVWIDDHGLMSRVLSGVRSHCWYAVKRAGMEIPYPQLVLHRPNAGDGGAAARTIATAALGNHPIFGFLGREQLDVLVRESPLRLFAAHEPVVTQGAAGGSMFLLVRGQVDVRIARDGQSTTVATLGPGDCLGEMSLLTGDPRTATVVAKAEVEAVEIGKDTFGTLIRANPAVVGRLGELLAQRQLANEKLASAADTAARIEQVRGSMLKKIRSFFQLAD